MNKLLILFLPLIVTGCSILPDIFKAKPKTVPPAPQYTFWDKEEFRQNGEIIEEISDEVYTTGTNQHSYEATVLKDSAEVMTMVLGSPSTEIDWKDPEEVKKLHERIRYAHQEFKQREHVWKSRVDGLSKQNLALQEENSVLKSFKNWFWLSVIALGALCFLFPTVGFGVVKFLVGRAKTAGEVALVEGGKALKGQFQQVTAAIEEYKKEDPEGAKKLGEKLKMETDSHTRDMIKNLKKGKLD
jgi:hypothetical protein